MTEESLLNGVEAEQEPKTIDQVEEEEYKASQEQKEEGARPEGLDDSFWDEDKKSLKSDALLDAYKKEQEKALGLRRKLSEKGSVKAPKDISEYTLDESVKELMPDESPALEVLRKNALDSGLSKDQFNSFMSKVLPELNEKGLIKNEPTEEQKAAEYEEFKTAELAKLGKDGPQVLQKIVNWGDSMVNKGILSRDELPVFKDFAFNADAMVVLNKIMALTGEPAIPVKTSVTNGLPSRAEIDQLIASPEYENGNADVHRKVKEYFEAVA